MCSATSRLIVQKGVAPRLLARLAAHAAAIKAGDPTLADTRLGPLVNAQQHGKVTAMIAAALAGGATALTGGGRPAAATPGGYFVEPTVLVGVSADAPIWKEEVFGPVLCVAEFGSEEEAVALANATDYGLGAAVLSLDPARCARMATAFEAGIVWVNCSQPTFAQLPWGGVKRSGFGRDLGPDALQNYLSPKQILTYVPTGTAFGYYAMDG